MKDIILEQGINNIQFCVVLNETEIRLILTFNKVFQNDYVHFKLKYENKYKVHPVYSVNVTQGEGHDALYDF